MSPLRVKPATYSGVVQERMDLGFEALHHALDRVRSSDPADRFAPLAESLIWLVMLNDAFWDDDQEEYRDHRERHPDGRTIEGLRYARHRLVHDIRVYGMHGAIYLGGDFDPSDFDRGDFDVGTPVWTWRPVHELDEAEDKAGEQVYRDLLQQNEVLPSLEAATEYLEEYRGHWRLL